MKLTQIKGVIFDLDGVLVDSEYLNWKGWQEVLKPFGILFSKEDFSNYTGKQGEIIDEELIKKHRLNVKKGFLYQEKRKILEKWLNSKEIKAMSYAKEAVNFFKKEGYKLAIATGSTKKEAKLKLKKIGLETQFSIIISASEVKKGKPSPDTYLVATKKLGLWPKECLAIEDTESGVQSTKSAGLFCFAISGKYSKKQDFSKANKIFKNLKEIIKWFLYRNF